LETNLVWLGSKELLCASLQRYACMYPSQHCRYHCGITDNSVTIRPCSFVGIINRISTAGGRDVAAACLWIWQPKHSPLNFYKLKLPSSRFLASWNIYEKINDHFTWCQTCRVLKYLWFSLQLVFETIFHGYYSSR
jgi:hypothetical protein